MNASKSHRVVFRSIGIIRSPFLEPEDMPIQPTGKASARGYAEIFPEFQAGLKDLDGFSHIILLYHLYKVRRVKLLVKPFLDDKLHGVFATRAPARPNPIGLTTAKIKKVEENRIYLEKIDVLDGTPLLDIKPYVPEFDEPQNIRTGWLESRKWNVGKQTSDDRFK